MTVVSFPGASAIIGCPARHNAVRVLRGKESATFRGHIAADIIEDVARDFCENRLAADLKCFEISSCELGLVVEHFLEMRHVPVGVDRIPMEAATEMIVDSAGRHFAQREANHFPGVLAAV